MQTNLQWWSIPFCRVMLFQEIHSRCLLYWFNAVQCLSLDCLDVWSSRVLTMDTVIRMSSTHGIYDVGWPGFHKSLVGPRHIFFTPQVSTDSSTISLDTRESLNVWLPANRQFLLLVASRGRPPLTCWYVCHCRFATTPRSSDRRRFYFLSCGKLSSSSDSNTCLMPAPLFNALTALPAFPIACVSFSLVEEVTKYCLIEDDGNSPHTILIRK